MILDVAHRDFKECPFIVLHHKLYNNSQFFSGKNHNLTNVKLFTVFHCIWYS